MTFFNTISWASNFASLFPGAFEMPYFKSTAFSNAVS
jgi:hypothetical protein